MNIFSKMNIIKEHGNIKVISMGLYFTDGIEFYAEFKDYILDKDNNTKCYIEDPVEIQRLKDSLSMKSIELPGEVTNYPHMAIDYTVPGEGLYSFKIRGNTHHIDFELGCWLVKIREVIDRPISIHMDEVEIPIFNDLMWSWNSRFNSLSIKTVPFDLNISTADIMNIKVSESNEWQSPIFDTKFMKIIHGYRSLV